MPDLTLNGSGAPLERTSSAGRVDERFIQIACRSDQEHDEPLTWGGKPMPYLHLNARSRRIQTEETEEV